jgi:hypothetical protein
MDDDIGKQITSHLNSQAAEMTALKSVLLVLVGRVLFAGPASPEEQLDQMKTDALGILNRTPLNPENSPKEARLGGRG